METRTISSIGNLRTHAKETSNESVFEPLYLKRNYSTLKGSFLSIRENREQNIYSERKRIVIENNYQHYIFKVNYYFQKMSVKNKLKFVNFHKALTHYFQMVHLVQPGRLT